MDNKPVVTEEGIPVTVLDKEEINNRLDRIDKDVREIAKQFKSIQQSLDAIYDDRDIITDVVNDVSKVRDLVIALDKKNQNLSQQTMETVEKKAEQIKAEVHIKTDDVKTKMIDKVVSGISKAFSKEDAKLIKIPWYRRLLFWRKRSTVNV